MKRDYNRPSDWDSFVLYKSQFEPISDLPDEALGRLFRHLFRWQIDGETDPEPDCAMAFKFIVNQFRIDDTKRMKVCKQNQDNGKLGGRPRKTERLLKKRMVSKKPNGGHNENDNDNVNDNGNVNVEVPSVLKLTLPFHGTEFVESWNRLIRHPKWIDKTPEALQATLDMMKRYSEDFMTFLIGLTLANDWGGLFYEDTPAKFERWKQSHPQRQTPITDINDIYKV